jgi:hypothetical protein
VLSRPVVSCWPLPGDSVARLGGSSAGRNRPIGRDRRRDVVVGNTGDSLGSLLPLPRSVGWAAPAGRARAGRLGSLPARARRAAAAVGRSFSSGRPSDV